ncbi:MAG: hypothetical protein ACT4OP_02530, partial [Actinomycetota bacterium]
MKNVPAGIPIKPFRAAKQRLGEVVSPSAREALSREMAHRTCLALTAAGADPLVLAADEQVEEWARGLGWEVRVEKGSDLNRAARSFVGSLPKGPWLICHADLPFIDGTVLAPV